MSVSDREMQKAISDIDILCGKVDSIEQAIREDRKRMERIEEDVDKTNDKNDEMLKLNYEIKAKIDAHMDTAEKNKNHNVIWIGFSITIILGLSSLAVSIIQAI